MSLEVFVKLFDIKDFLWLFCVKEKEYQLNPICLPKRFIWKYRFFFVSLQGELRLTTVQSTY